MHSGNGVAAKDGSDPNCRRFLAALFSDAPRAACIELRVRTQYGMRSTWTDSSDLHEVESTITRDARNADVYVGVIPRLRRGGSRSDLCASASVLWADCDSAASVSALSHFDPPPSIEIASGTGDNRHAYWLLSEPVTLDVVEAANRRIAYLLSADAHCADAARILRPPASWNHKHTPPSRVCLLRCDAKRRHQLDEVVGVIRDEARVRRGTSIDSRPRDSDDPLLALPPEHYVEQLAQLDVPRHRKIRCPFHDDDTPSLHVYTSPERGWFCFGCGRGGSIYDFAAQLWGRGTRGRDFVVLREEIQQRLELHTP